MSAPFTVTVRPAVARSPSLSVIVYSSLISGCSSLPSSFTASRLLSSVKPYPPSAVSVSVPYSVSTVYPPFPSDTALSPNSLTFQLTLGASPACSSAPKSAFPSLSTFPTTASVSPSVTSADTDSMLGTSSTTLICTVAVPVFPETSLRGISITATPAAVSCPCAECV